MTSPGIKGKEISKIDESIKIILQELDEVNRSIRETSAMVEQSRMELGKLSQRNTAVTSLLQKFQSAGGDTKVEEIEAGI